MNAVDLGEAWKSSASDAQKHFEGKGAAAERAQIVAWLRQHPNLSATMREHIAAQIERGEYAAAPQGKPGE